MHPRIFLAALLIAPTALASKAQANDSSALLEAGGIVLTTSKDVTMESEDLWISSDLVRVSYVFRNVGAEDVRTEVAFPVPGLPICDEDHASECEGDMQIRGGPNPLSFKLTVDGKPKAFKTDQKKEIQGGVGKLWITHHWEQFFPKDRMVKITHEYVPVAGGFFTHADSAFEREMSETYCVGPKLLGALTSKEHWVRTVHYILTTGANWKGPIRTFKLTLAKATAKDKVSLCIPDTRRATNTTFEVLRANFVPKQDLKILFIPANP